MSIIYIDRQDGQQKIEKVYRGRFLTLIYGDHFLNKLFYWLFLPLIACFSFFSRIYGALQKRSASAKKIVPFIKKFDIDSSEFKESVSSFHSFNDFFIRKLKPECRPLAPGEQVAIIPADGRYYFYQDISLTDGFIVKGKKFDLATLLDDAQLAQEYAHGAMVLARLCPSDYHRYHFPCACTPQQAKLIQGHLYSVNPIAIRRHLNIFTENKRVVTLLDSEVFGQIVYIEIGATNVGSIQQTYTPLQTYAKGDEKGYFEFGGSALILLFQQGKIRFEADLLAATKQGLEMRCLLGQPLGSTL